MSAERASFSDLESETESILSNDDTMEDSTLTNGRLQEIKRELRNKVIASIKEEIEKRERSFNTLSSMYVDMKTELEQTKARCSELEKKVETMELKSSEYEHRSEESTVLVEKFSKDHEEYKIFYEESTKKLNKLVQEKIFEGARSKMTDDQWDEMTKKRMLEVGLNPNVLEPSSSEDDVFLLLKALSNGVEEANIKLSSSFRADKYRVNDWCFSIKYNDDDQLFKWVVEMECPGDTFPYCISLLHSTRCKKTKRENLHKRLHASFYSGIDVMFFNRVHRKLQWNPFTNQIMGVQHNELLENHDTKWQNFRGIKTQRKYKKQSTRDVVHNYLRYERKSALID
ncbi:unnamed protein product [Oikopleura dioica]|uniref:Uncharacterized protein n=1 Tax=Oikopleura dioica TaxID=34765 RepID=E4WV38_OIKDI|nr:unnamed protein product [Oikopleura dioica]CBY35843.1 unnamed protein product [Oikopleura dioica]